LNKIEVYTDGASRNNPGHAGIGIVIYDENNFIIRTYKEYIGQATNNQAEYRALIKSVELIRKLDFDRVEFYSDSELLVNQINYDYRLNEPELALLNNKFHVLMKKLGKPYSISHVERGKNKNADMLANKAIDSRVRKSVKRSIR
jgi:ribonuclease HI